ncbi:MAG: hypothetical protein ACK47B_18600 [Armatimonadota bacterium]
MQQQLSRPLIIGVLVLVGALFVGLLWLGTGPRAGTSPTSTLVERQESSETFSQAVREHNQREQALTENPEARAARDAYRDNDYQPESGN